MKFRTGLGQDSHAFESKKGKPCVIGGVTISDHVGLDADSDGDVIFHAICNAITSLTGVSILGEIAPKLCKEQGIKDSKVYLEKALQTLGEEKIHHVALSLEGKTPRLQKHIPSLCENVSKVLKISPKQVGITITSGDGLTAFGRGEGLQCFCIITTFQEKEAE